MYAYQKRLYCFFIILNFAVLQNIIQISCVPHGLDQTGSIESGSIKSGSDESGSDEFYDSKAESNEFKHLDSDPIYYDVGDDAMPHGFEQVHRAATTTDEQYLEQLKRRYNKFYNGNIPHKTLMEMLKKQNEYAARQYNYDDTDSSGESSKISTKQFYADYLAHMNMNMGMVLLCVFIVGGLLTVVVNSGLRYVKPTKKVTALELVETPKTVEASHKKVRQPSNRM